MNRKKFEYFLNAVHYCMWRNQKRFKYYVCKIVFAFISLITKGLFTSEYRSKLHSRQRAVLNDCKTDSNKTINRWNVYMTHHWFGFVCAGYPACFSFILLGLGNRIFGHLSTILVIFLIFAPIGLCYLWVDKIIYDKNHYMRYFRKFECKDEKWLRKWSGITALFCLGSVFSFIAGIVAMTVIDPIKP